MAEEHEVNRRYLVEALPFGPKSMELHCPDCVHPDEWERFKRNGDGVLIGILAGFPAPIWRCIVCSKELVVLEVWPDEEGAK